MDLYSGQEFIIDYKYSQILNIVFITMTFGYGIPLLFPLAALQFLVFYVIEVLQLFYSYKQPPMYD